MRAAVELAAATGREAGQGRADRDRAGHPAQLPREHPRRAAPLRDRPQPPRRRGRLPAGEAGSGQLRSPTSSAPSRGRSRASAAARPRTLTTPARPPRRCRGCGSPCGQNLRKRRRARDRRGYRRRHAARSRSTSSPRTRRPGSRGSARRRRGRRFGATGLGRRADVDDVASGELELLGLAARQLRPGVLAARQLELDPDLEAEMDDARAPSPRSSRRLGVQRHGHVVRSHQLAVERRRPGRRTPSRNRWRAGRRCRAASRPARSCRRSSPRSGRRPPSPPPGRG